MLDLPMRHEIVWATVYGDTDEERGRIRAAVATIDPWATKLDATLWLISVPVLAPDTRAQVLRQLPPSCHRHEIGAAPLAAEAAVLIRDATGRVDDVRLEPGPKPRPNGRGMLERALLSRPSTPSLPQLLERIAEFPLPRATPLPRRRGPLR